MMRIPRVYNTEVIRHWNVQKELMIGKKSIWVLARSLPYYQLPIYNMRRRIKIAYLVFIGKYDALEWL